MHRARMKDTVGSVSLMFGFGIDTVMNKKPQTDPMTHHRRPPGKIGSLWPPLDRGVPAR